jgi:D-3-phosphoglycerate dehydrogenase
VLLDGPVGPGDIEERELSRVGAVLNRLPSTGTNDLAAFVQDADAILCDTTPINADLLDRAPRVQIISEYGIGFDNIDVGAASQRGIWVANVPGFCVEEVADHTLALILAASRQIIPLDRSVRDGRWDAIGVARGATRLSSQTLGLIGFGQIARLVARRARGFGLKVLAYSRSLTVEEGRQHGIERAELAELLARSDYVSLHLPASAQTRGLIDDAALARLKPTAWLINTARGSLVDEAALSRALREGRLAGAALDVREREPARLDDPFRDLPNVILTPHAAYYSVQSLEELRRRAAANVAAVLAGGPPNDPVNPYLKPRFGRDARSGPDVWV